MVLVIATKAPDIVIGVNKSQNIIIAEVNLPRQPEITIVIVNPTKSITALIETPKRGNLTLAT